MILAGLQFGLSKPAANSFINVFREGLDDLFRGVNLTLNDQSEIKIRGIVMCGTCDLPAESQFLNMKQFNGDYGCQFCKQKTSNSKILMFTRMKKNYTCVLQKKPNNMQKQLLWVFGSRALSQFVYKHEETTAVDIEHCLANMVKKLGFL